MRVTDPDFLHYLKTGNMNLTENLGIPTVKGIKFKDLSKADLLGFKEMLKQLEPSQLILYGAITDAIREQIHGIPYKHIDSEQKQRMEKYSQRQK